MVVRKATTAESCLPRISKNRVMTPQQYLESVLAIPFTPLSEVDQKALEKTGMEEFLYSKLTSKKFRKWRVDELSEKQVRHAIHLAISENKPYSFVTPSVATNFGDCQVRQR